ncbi:hypothetical protein V6N13_048322 [Hibiscus sabdariffa]
MASSTTQIKSTFLLVLGCWLPFIENTQPPITQKHFLRSKIGETVAVEPPSYGVLKTTASVSGGKPTIITNAEGIEQRRPWWRVPRVGTGDRLVGQIAKRQAVVNPENTFFSVKRFMGIKISEVDEEYKHISYKISRDDNGNVKLECPVTGKRFAAEEISAQVLRKLVDDASKFLNDEVRRLVEKLIICKCALLDVGVMEYIRW